MANSAEPLGKVSSHLLDTIRRQINQNGIVIWYDPKGDYRGFVESLPAEELPGIPLERYDGSFIALRHRIEPLLSGEERPKLLIYIPLDRAETKDAMIEAEAAGVILQPGARPLNRNTRLSVIAKSVLKECCSPDKLRRIERDVEEGKLNLAELDRIAEDAAPTTGPVLEIIFKTKVPGEMALLFLSGSGYDEELQRRGALPDLSSLLAQEFELPSGEESRPEDLRQRFARFVLATELLAAIGERPAKLAGVPIPSSQRCLESCIRLAKTWRSRRELAESYRILSEGVSQDLSLSKVQLSLNQLQATETFLEADRSLQSAVATEMQQSIKENLVRIARERREGFWSTLIPETKARWETIAAAGELLLEANRVEIELKSLPESARAFFDAYTSGPHPWHLLDAAQRCMDQIYLSLNDIDDLLERLVRMARGRYMEAGSELCERFLRLYQKDGFQIQGALRQAEIFDKKVRPSLDEGRTAYIWVDALRLEMAHRLADILSDEFDVKITPALARAPTVTEIGMASLLPGSIDGRVVPAGEGRLALEIGGTPIKSRPDRMKYLDGYIKKSGLGFFSCNLDDLLPKPRNSIREAIGEADLILVTSQEIDELCESDNISLARSSMSELLHRLQGTLRILSGLGIDRFILTADHGYIFGEELGEEMKINPPGGETLDLTRRFWVGRGGNADSSYLRLRLSDLGQAGDLEMAVPWRFACFRVNGGARAYFHGGLSPQEVIVPVLTMTALRKKQENEREIVWSLAHAGKVTTRIFLVRISGRAKKFQPVVPPTIRLELWDGNSPVSEIDGASYGFINDTKEVKLTTLGGDPYGLAPNVVTLKITKQLIGKKLSLHLIDARTGVELAQEKELDVFIQEY